MTSRGSGAAGRSGDFAGSCAAAAPPEPILRRSGEAAVAAAGRRCGDSAMATAVRCAGCAVACKSTWQLPRRWPIDSREHS